MRINAIVEEETTLDFLMQQPAPQSVTGLGFSLAQKGDARIPRGYAYNRDGIHARWFVPIGSEKPSFFVEINSEGPDYAYGAKDMEREELEHSMQSLLRIKASTPPTELLPAAAAWLEANGFRHVGIYTP